MLQRIREHYTLALLLLLPFHAFLVTVLTRVLVGKFQGTPLWLTVWKEVALLLLLGWVVFEIISKKEHIKRIWQLDKLDYIIIATCALGLVVSLLQGIPLKQLAYGIKYDLWPLGLLFVYRRVHWSTALKQRIAFVVPILGVVIALIGIVFMLVPISVLEWFGYSETHSLFMAHKPVAAFQQIGASAIRRLQTTFSGPNQAGIWLLIPLGFVWAKLVSTMPSRYSFKGIYRYKLQHKWYILTALIVVTGILLTFSRSAWLGSLAMFVAGIFVIAKHNYAKNMVTGFMVVMAVVAVVASQLFPQVIKRDLSSKGHLERPLEAIQTMLSNPIGLGLGAAGPVSNHLSDSCTIVDEGSDIRWADPYPELCIFSGNTQLKPIDRNCNCAVVTENWYLQLGVEMGILGLLLSLAYAAYILLRLRNSTTVFVSAVWLAFLGISVVGLFLHAWEDSGVAYTMALLLAMALPFKSIEHRA